MKVEVQDLRVLRAVADSGSLAGAARALGVHQAAVTRRVQHLERATGLVVLHRDHRGAYLTGAGRLLLRCADELLPRIDRLLAAGSPGGTPGPTAERLRIGAVPSSALPLVTARAQALFPSAVIELRTVTGAYREPSDDTRPDDCGAALLSLFRLQRLDLAVVRHSAVLGGPLPDPLDHAVLAEENLLVGTGEGHRLARRPSLALADLEGERCLLAGGRRHAVLRRHFTAAVRRAEVGVGLHWAPDEAEAAAVACAVRGVLPAYPFPAPAAGVVYVPLSDAVTRHELLLVWSSDGPAAAWAPRLADTVRAAYPGAAYPGAAGPGWPGA
ncbi:LysR family transcriptional regulator [Streptomyces chumphonensis]|uniref:LysR family transcriptional regulator n=1 Tax=Streptomyces chumphonensis TaxID=1214925 RepID=A0A927F140_9ACTN|nr:LysR family transcriptional regulator [Streptomyces chumphonensis]MBD3933281.1 LysR family transcriptional regulator [Streptomyces chumphonensis]